MKNRFVYEVEIPLFWNEGILKVGDVYGIENEKHEIFLENALSHEDKKQNILNYKYYDFEEEIDCPDLIKNLKDFVSNYELKYDEEIKETAIILEFTVDFKNNYYFKGTYREGENDYDSARYHYERESFDKKDVMNPSKNSKYFIQGPSGYINYAEILFDVVNQTDKENWDYFSENSSTLAKDFLDYGSFSRILIMRDYKNNEEIPVGYVQFRILKTTAPPLLYKDLYHHVGLGGDSLWEKASYLKEGLPIYIDVIAIKNEYQHNLSILKLVPEAIQDVIKEIHETTQGVFEIYAVGVTDVGRKMCEILRMKQLSEVIRTENNISHTRTLFCSEYLDFTKRLKKICN